MTEQLISELENAGRIVLAPPNIVTNEQRRNAEKVFMNFRKTNSPYPICREILEKSENHYLIFEAAQLLRQAVISEWSFMLESDKTLFLQYLLNYVSTREVPSFAEDRILQVIAIMIKRTSIDDSGRSRANILQEVENLIINGDDRKKMLGCRLIYNLMQEYASTVNSTDVGLAWEVHFKAKKQFEATDLKRIFQFCIYLLFEVVKNDPPYSDTMMTFIEDLLKITKTVLSWGFISPILPKRLIGIYESIYESDEAPALKLTTSWSEIILNPDLLPLMFEIYWKLKNMEELADHSLKCLVQLSSLSGGIVASDETRLKYFHSYLMMFFKLISNLTINSKESISISRIVKNLMLFYVHDISKLPTSVQDTLIKEFSRLTCNFCEGADFLDDTNTEEEVERATLFGCAFDRMLEALSTIVREFGSSSDKNFIECITQIFNKYVQCHLAPPDGNRKHRIPQNRTPTMDHPISPERSTYKSQLQNVGMFGRLIPEHALPLLFRLLEARIEKLVNNIQMWQSVPRNGFEISHSEQAMLNDLFRDIHFIILISGHVLCMESEGETPMIPSEIMQYSIELHNNRETTLEATLKALIAIESKVAIPETFNQCDHVIRIVFNMMKISTVEDYIVSVNEHRLLDNDVGCSLVWFLKRWCLAYLLPIEHYYEQLSPTLVGSLGLDTSSATIITNFVMTKIQFNISYFKLRKFCLKDTIDLFCSMVSVKHKSILILTTKSMRTFLHFFKEIKPGQLPPQIYRGLCKGFVLAGAALSNPEDMNSYFEMILTPILHKLTNIILQWETFIKNYETEEVRQIVIDTLECLIGIVTGSLVTSVEILFHMLTPMLVHLPKLLCVYCNNEIILPLILDFFGQCSKYMLCYLSQVDSKKLYESSLAIVHGYMDNSRDRYDINNFRHNDNYEELELILDLLNFTLSKDCIDLSSDSNNEEMNITAADVVIFSLNYVMPTLMKINALQCPGISTRFYRTLILLIDIYPEKMCNLNPDLEDFVLRAVEMGLYSFGNEAVQASLDFIQGMATYVFKHNKVASPFSQKLKPFLTTVMDLTLRNQIDADLISSASTCIYALMCCYQEDYQLLVQKIIQLQSDPVIVERLTSAFCSLTELVAMNCERQPKLRFRDNFDKFFANVCGFLLFK